MGNGQSRRVQGYACALDNDKQFAGVRDVSPASLYHAAGASRLRHHLSNSAYRHPKLARAHRGAPTARSGGRLPQA